jgi:hypothetical protein
MNLKQTVAASGALGLGLAMLAIPARAQGPLYDKVIVDLPYSVTIGDKVLKPGNYEIRQNDSMGGGNRVLLIYGGGDNHFITSTLTIPALDNLTPRDTRVVLHRFGNDYYFDKIWIEGKNYGYEFPLPESVKSRERERMQPVAVAARYEAMPPKEQAAAPPPPPEAPPAPPEAEREQPQPEAPPAPAPAPAMPHTDSGWMMMLLSGGALSLSGLVLRRKA